METINKFVEKVASWTWFGFVGFFLSILVAVLFNLSDSADNEKLIILSPALGFIFSAFLEMGFSYLRTKDAEKNGESGYDGPSVGTEVLKSLIGSILAALAIAGLVIGG